MNTRMVSAEFLRIRRNRALVIWAFILTSGAVAALYIIAQGFHWNDSVNNGPAGGADNLRHGLVVLSLIGGVAAAIVGTSVGTSDLTAGVFRDLVVTGRSRWGLFFSRVPGMLVFWIPLIVIAYAVAVVLDFAFAGGLATPSTTAIVKDGLWVVFVTSIALCVSLGVSAVIGSRGISIGVLLGWELAATPLLLNISLLGVTRELLLESATRRIQPFFSEDAAIGTSLAAAIVVLALWIVVPLALGAWRTATRDV
jgi:ABC-type transport system involved in multi-copper enzyme maturation permease subunit